MYRDILADEAEWGKLRRLVDDPRVSDRCFRVYCAWLSCGQKRPQTIQACALRLGYSFSETRAALDLLAALGYIGEAK